MLACPAFPRRGSRSRPVSRHGQLQGSRPFRLYCVRLSVSPEPVPSRWTEATEQHASCVAPHGTPNPLRSAAQTQQCIGSCPSSSSLPYLRQCNEWERGRRRCSLLLFIPKRRVVVLLLPADRGDGHCVVVMALSCLRHNPPAVSTFRLNQ